MARKSPQNSIVVDSNEMLCTYILQNPTWKNQSEKLSSWQEKFLTSCFVFSNFQNKLINTGPKPWRLLIFSLIWMLVEWWLYKFFSVEFVTDVFYNAKAKDLCVHYLLGNIEHFMWYRVLYHRQMQNLFKWQQFRKILSITTQHHERPKKQL